MMGFTGAAITIALIYHLIADHNRWLPTAPSISFLRFQRFPFHYGLLNKFLRPINSLFN
jgi:hypothetical protein